MEIISLPPFSPLNRGTEGVFLTSDIRHQPSSGDERRQLFLLLHREAALHRGHVLIFNQRKFAPVEKSKKIGDLFV